MYGAVLDVCVTPWRSQKNGSVRATVLISLTASLTRKIAGWDRQPKHCGATRYYKPENRHFTHDFVFSGGRAFCFVALLSRKPRRGAAKHDEEKKGRRALCEKSHINEYQEQGR